MIRRALATRAVSEALRVRLRANVSLTDPANPVDIAEKLGVQVWFKRLPSAEGFFLRAPHPLILLSSSRYAGRMAFTCGHELGHFWLQHPGHVDAETGEHMLTEDSDNEYQANLFAAYLLMPKSTVQHAFADRGVAPEMASPWTVLAVSHWLGVGYSTLIRHLNIHLKLLSDSRSSELLRVRPSEIVNDFVSVGTGITAFVVDRAWRSRTVDMEIGDHMILDGAVKITGTALEFRESRGGKFLVEAVRAGTGHIDVDGGWATYVRVRRRRFEGRAIFRHLEEADDE